MHSKLVKHGTQYCRNPRNTIIKDQYYRTHRIYNKLRKQKFRTYHCSFIDQLNTLKSSDPKKYWKLLYELKHNSKNTTDTSISCNDWRDHFKKLNKTPEDFQVQGQFLQDQLKEAEKTSLPIFNELDFHITLKEINKAKRKLKHSKAAGPDRICNEMIKHGQTFLTSILLKIFNASLSLKYYPSAWCEGYITPVYKSNKTIDPNNYR
jgi:hypothetical protein